MTSLAASVHDTESVLRHAGVPSPQAVARTLVAWIASVEPWQIPVVPDLEGKQREALADAIGKVVSGLPVQYVTGIAYFRTVSVQVGEGVFIPRPETELLAGWAIDCVKHGRERVVELCAGSGAISLSILTESSPTALWAVEKSPAAVGYLQANLAKTTATVVKADMADALSEEDGTIDIVVVNPPYIPLSAKDSLSPDVLHDPQIALFSGPDGLDAIRVVASTAWRLLAASGCLGVEHGDGQESDVEDILTRSGYLDIESHGDLTGRARFVTCRKPDME